MQCHEDQVLVVGAGCATKCMHVTSTERRVLLGHSAAFRAEVSAVLLAHRCQNIKIDTIHPLVVRIRGGDDVCALAAHACLSVTLALEALSLPR